MLHVEYVNVEHVNDLLEAINFPFIHPKSIISLTFEVVEERDVKWIGSFGPGDLKDCVNGRIQSAPKAEIPFCFNCRS